MMEILHWDDSPAGDQRALRFFRQHPRGYTSAIRRGTATTLRKFAGDPVTPTVAHFVVTTGDGVARWCSAGKHWTWDGKRFHAELCGPGCGEHLITDPKPCSFPGCGKPTAYVTKLGAGSVGQGWQHVDPADETDTHVGYPMPREAG